MKSVREVLVQTLTDLGELAIPHALVGGLAVSARVEPRMTRDVDAAVAVKSDAEAEQTILALQARGYGVHAVVEQTATGRMATARLLPPGGSDAGVVVDILFASSGIEPEVVAASDRIEVVSGTTAPVATIGHLIALKLLATSEDRPQDAVDLVRLRAAASTEDLKQARNAVRLIDELGYSRGRDLETALDELLGSDS